MSRSDSSRVPASPRRRSDLRFAGFISAGTIATVLTLAALVAPLLAWKGSPTQNARERSQTVRLSEPPARAVPGPGPFSMDRTTRLAAAAAGRLILPTAALRAAAERRAAAEVARPERAPRRLRALDGADQQPAAHHPARDRDRRHRRRRAARRLGAPLRPRSRERRRRRGGHRRRRPRQPDRAADPHEADRRRLRRQRRPRRRRGLRRRRPAQRRRARGGLEPVAGRLQRRRHQRRPGRPRRRRRRPTSPSSRPGPTPARARTSRPSSRSPSRRRA